MLCPFYGRFKVTSPRGYRILNGKREYHGGLDLVALDSSAVYSISDGTVEPTPYETNGFGWYVRVRLDNGNRIYYGHLADKPLVSSGRIKAGTLLGYMGSTGNSTGAHTHLELRGRGYDKTSLDISEYTGIPNKIGVYYSDNEFLDIEEQWKLLQDKCDFEQQTIDYLKTYQYSNDLLLKLLKQMA